MPRCKLCQQTIQAEERVKPVLPHDMAKKDMVNKTDHYG